MPSLTVSCMQEEDSCGSICLSAPQQHHVVLWALGPACVWCLHVVHVWMLTQLLLAHETQRSEPSCKSIVASTYGQTSGLTESEGMPALLW